MKVLGAFKLTKKLSEWLKVMGWSQRDFCERAKINETLLSQIISGERHPSWQTLRKICSITRFQPGDLLYFDFDSKQEETDK